MRKINPKIIKEKVKELVIKANTDLRKDVLEALKKALPQERNPLARKALLAIIENAGIAQKQKLAICQDTGFPIVFLEMGDEVYVPGNLKEIISGAVKEGYQKGFFRASIQPDALFRKQKTAYQPLIIHIDIVKNRKIKITFLPKGFGCENKTQLKMFNPTADISQIKKFIIEAVKAAGSDACPPYIVGVGIGGTADYACFLAKKALLRKIKNQKSKIKITNQNLKIYKLEKELLKKINKLNIGPMGLGGKTTCLAVNIETYPTHIAGLPVAVNINCHALRSASLIV